jgi:hypothetical protein
LIPSAGAAGTAVAEPVRAVNDAAGTDLADNHILADGTAAAPAKPHQQHASGVTQTPLQKTTPPTILTANRQKTASQENYIIRHITTRLPASKLICWFRQNCRKRP